MDFRDDRRAAAIQVGAVLLLGFLVIALSLYQVTVVPEQNKRVEFRHSQAVQNDLLDLRNALLRAGTSEGVQPVSVDLGTTYPSRVVFVNPPPPGGLLRNGTARNVTVTNASATNAETRDFLNTSANGPYNLSTKNVSYRPGYNVFQSAPTTTYQSGVTVNEFENANDTANSGQPLVRGNRIYLVAVAGNLSRAQIGSVAVDPRSLSRSTRTTTIGNTTEGNLTLTVPTTLSADRWETLLDAELDPAATDPDRYVTGVSAGPRPGTVNVTFEANETYRLKTAYVAVGTGGSTPGPRYMTNVTDTNATVRSGDEIAVEVRDPFNNPVDPTAAGGVRVNVTNGTGLVQANDTAVEDDGRARFTYTGGAGNGTSLNLSIDSRDVPARNASTNVTFEVTDGTTLDGDGAGDDTGRDINPPGDLILVESSIYQGTGPDPDRVNVTFENIGSNELNVTSARFNFYYRDSQGGAGVTTPDSVEFAGEFLNKSGRYVDVSVNVPPGEETLTLTFYDGENGTGGTYDPDEGDFFVISVIVDDGESTATYFIAPE